ncbi:MAG: ABC transporter ATP-binding protein [Sneathiellaceae bacterium]
MARLDLTGLCKAFDTSQVLRDVSLTIDDGEFLAVVGPSGCGKSTLLRVIAGLETQDAGQVRIGDRLVDGLPPKQRDVAMVFQSYALYPHMTVAQNLALPLVMRDLSRWQRMPFAARLSTEVARRRAAVQEAVRQAAGIVELTPLLDRKPRQLSGGQRQRVALARALVRQPRLFLLDEPLSNLDASLRASTRTEIVDLQRRLGVTTVYVTHDQVEAMTMASRIAVMIGGRIVQLGTAREIYRRPVDIRVAQFIGTPKMNLLPGEVARGAIRIAGAAEVLTTLPLLRDGALTIGIRAEHLHLSHGPGPGALRSVVRQVEFLGAEALVHLQPDSLPQVAPLAARVPPEVAAGLAPGMTVGLTLAPAGLHLFDSEGQRIARSGADAGLPPETPARPLAAAFAPAAALAAR